MVFATTAMLDAAQEARPHTIDNRQVDTKRAMPRGVGNFTFCSKFRNVLLHATMMLICYFVMMFVVEIIPYGC